MNAEALLQKMYAWLLDKGPAVLAAAIVLFIGLWVIRALSGYLRKWMERRQINGSLRPFLRSMLVTLLRMLLLLAVMQIAGIRMTIFAALVTSFGVAAGLALSGTLQNFTSGVLILFLKPFQAGDTIIAQGHEGTVTEIMIFYTIVTTFDNRIIVIPNSKLSNEVIINESASGNRRLDIEIKFSSNTDYGEVKKVMEAAITDAGNVLSVPPKRIGVSSLEPDGYKVMLNLWISAPDFTAAKMEFQEKLLQQLKASV
ncbi:Ion channel protein [Niabella ginsenosidivorans]|uniref:Ion channel protein n=1 Tax=Niabella ginsenosidivorans TaxID=1176587 RepID=A0A1A9I2J0_9BACT|nr:mechanosensitive ion channel family protein [Niabella ginsenosidivorans]ANH81877.1 Ion channel protein [Niabella ginsenosidivorans]